MSVIIECITREEANRLFNASPWDLMAPLDIVKFQMGCGRACVPEDTFHSSVNYLLGRIVDENWLADDIENGWEKLVKELFGKHVPEMSFVDTVNLLPEQYRDLIKLGK